MIHVERRRNLNHWKARNLFDLIKVSWRWRVDNRMIDKEKVLFRRKASDFRRFRIVRICDRRIVESEKRKANAKSERWILIFQQRKNSKLRLKFRIVDSSKSRIDWSIWLWRYWHVEKSRLRRKMSRNYWRRKAFKCWVDFKTHKEVLKNCRLSKINSITSKLI